MGLKVDPTHAIYMGQLPALPDAVYGPDHCLVCQVNLVWIVLVGVGGEGWELRAVRGVVCCEPSAATTVLSCALCERFTVGVWCLSQLSTLLLRGGVHLVTVAPSFPSPPPPLLLIPSSSSSPSISPSSSPSPPPPPHPPPSPHPPPPHPSPPPPPGKMHLGRCKSFLGLKKFDDAIRACGQV
eukprot:1267830-Rhodomonas_salina.1